MYKAPDGPTSPTLMQARHSQNFFAPSNLTGNSRTASRTTSGTQAPSTAGNFPGMKSETSSLSGESGVSTPPSQSPPRSNTDKQTTFAGGKPRPLRLVQENPDALKDNKRASWYAGWSWGKKEEGGQQQQQPPGQQPLQNGAIPE